MSTITGNRVARFVAAVLVAGTAVLATAGTASAETVPADGYEPGATTTAITFGGARNGDLADASTSCIGGGIWEITGNLEGTPLDMFVTFGQGDPGEGTFPMDVGVDPGQGIATVTVDDQNFVTDSGGENTGTFTVDPGGRSGSIDVRAATTDQQDAVDVEGTWSCS